MFLDLNLDISAIKLNELFDPRLCVFDVKFYDLAMKFGHQRWALPPRL